MAMRHGLPPRAWICRPESVLTESGKALSENCLGRLTPRCRTTSSPARSTRFSFQRPAPPSRPAPVLSPITVRSDTFNAPRSPGSSSRCARRARPSSGFTDSPARCARSQRPPIDRRRPRRHGRHGQRQADLQRLDDGGADRRGRRVARSPSTATGRQPGCSGSADVSRGARRADQLEARRRRPLHRPRRLQLRVRRTPAPPATSSPSSEELAVRTIFDFLGPLQPGRSPAAACSASPDPAFLERMAGALARLGATGRCYISSEDGLDEMRHVATHVVEVNGDTIQRYVVAPADVGIEGSPFDAGARRDAQQERRATTRRDPRADGARGHRRLQRGRRDLRGSLAGSIAEGVEAAPRRSTSSSRGRSTTTSP